MLFMQLLKCVNALQKKVRKECLIRVTVLNMMAKQASLK